eukprot:Plantae.Rhodophyta-Rhodochaete_pulchella.ctg299.p1 GENE.Plantae.Rhodophyta-Rhodochaete_pulchella.ctg299~~Plantae.Rhodophyta-Rhodochaete_pulchella.ctg299.p1  ORF type:complete len:610 (-),score=91.01 Plantae.Rhodophyta-Rhodochaete_pulchella.ctg299:167-1996(-)
MIRERTANTFKSVLTRGSSDYEGVTRTHSLDSGSSAELWMPEQKYNSVERLQRILRKAKVNSPATLRMVLEAMFELDDLVPEKIQVKLYDYLLKDKNLQRMAMMLTSERSDVDAAEDTLTARDVNRYRYVVCLFILYGPPRGRQCIASNEDLMRPLLKFLTTERPVSVIGIEYVARVVASLLHTSPLDCCRHIAAHPSFLPDILRRISVGSVSQLIQRMICERAFYDEEELNFGPINHHAVRILAECDMQDLLADTFIDTASMGIFVHETVKVVENTVGTMFQMSLRAMMSARHCVMIDSIQIPGSMPFGESLSKLDLIQNTAPLVKVFDAALDAPPYVLTALLQGMIQLLTATLKGRTSKIPVVRKVVWNVSLREVLDVISERIPRLLKCLGVSSPPLGSERLEVCKFFEVCFQSGDEILCKKMVKHGVHATLLTLVFKMPRNSILHPLVVSALRSSLQSRIPELESAWLGDLEIVKRIIDTWNKQDPIDVDPPALASTVLEMAQLISDHIVTNASEDHPRDMNSLLGKANFDAFVKFRSTVLKKKMAMEADGICGRPEKPVGSRTDSDYVYDEDEMEALWIYNRLIDKEMGEDTEEGAIRAGKTKRR